VQCSTVLTGEALDEGRVERGAVLRVELQGTPWASSSGAITPDKSTAAWTERGRDK